MHAIMGTHPAIDQNPLEDMTNETTAPPPVALQQNSDLIEVKLPTNNAAPQQRCSHSCDATLMQITQ